MTYQVKLNIYRGAGTHPIGRKEMTIESDSALNASGRCEELVNVVVAENEYAAVSAVWPLSEPRPKSVLAMAA